MNLINTARNIVSFWPHLRKATGGCLILEKPGCKPDTVRMTTITFTINAGTLALELLAHIDRMVLRDDLDVLTATKLVSDQLGKLVTLQVNTGRGDPIAVAVAEAFRQAGIGPVIGGEPAHE